MAYRTRRIRRAQRWIRWRYALGNHAFRALWKWANKEEKLFRFRMLVKWAKTRQEKARTRKAAEKFKKFRYAAAWKVEQILDAQKAASASVCSSSGDPCWGGGRDILEREVAPVAARHGAPITSRKRTSTLGNPSSDHYVGNVLAYALDIGTFSGAGLAHDIADALGIDNYSTGNYNGYLIHRDGHTYRIQILWAVSGHWDHVHVGCRRVS
jgi:hypothetical protein